MSEQFDPILGLSYGYDLGEDGWKAGMDRNLLYIGAVLQLSVTSAALTAPPGGPSAGDRYIVGAAATGAWATHDDKIAVYNGSGWTFLVPKEGFVCYDRNTNAYLRYDGSWAAMIANPTEQLIVAAGDESTPISVGDDQVTIYVTYNCLIDEVFTGLTAQSTAGDVTTDIELNGTTIFGTLPVIQANEDTSLTGTPGVLTGGVPVAASKGDKLTFNVDGAGTGAAGLKFYIRLRRT